MFEKLPFNMKVTQDLAEVILGEALVWLIEILLESIGTLT